MSKPEVFFDADGVPYYLRVGPELTEEEMRSAHDLGKYTPPAIFDVPIDQRVGREEIKMGADRFYGQRYPHITQQRWVIDYLSRREGFDPGATLRVEVRWSDGSTSDVFWRRIPDVGQAWLEVPKEEEK